MNSRRKLFCALGAGALAVMALMGYLIWLGHRDAIRTAGTASRNYAAIIEARLDATLRRADAEVQGAVRDLPVAALSKQAVPRYAREINAGLDMRLLNFPELAGLRVFDANGDMIYTSASNISPRTHISDRGYFTALRDNPQAGLVFSEVVVARTTGRQGVAIARALRDKQGIFRGIVSAGISIDYFRKLAQSLDLGARGVLAIYRTDDFTPLVRWPAIKESLNTPLPPSAPTRMDVTAGKKTGTLTFSAVSDGIARIYSFHALDRYPYYVTIGIAREDALAGWRTRSLAAGLLGLLLLGLLVGALARLWRADARRAQAERDIRALNANLEQSIAERTAKLRESERRLAFVLAETPATIYVCQSEPPYAATFVSENITKSLGYSTEEFLSTPDFWADHIHPEDRERVFAGLPRLFETGNYTYEYCFRHKDGSWRWMYDEVQVVRGPEGKAVELIGYFIDITERRQAEEALQLTQFSVDHAVDSVFWIKPDAEIIYVNDAACRTLGYAREELVGKTVPDIDPNFPAEAWPAHWDELRRQKSLTFESDHYTRDGGLIQTEVTANYIQFQGREYNCAVMRDITRRKRAEETRSRLAAIVETSDDAIISRSLDSIILSWNAAAERLFGYTAAEAIGQNSLMLVPPDRREESRRNRALVAQGKTVLDFETVRLARHNRRIDVSVSLSPIRDDGGAMVGASLIFRDITKRKRVEALQREAEERVHQLLRRLIDTQEGERRRLAADLHDLVGQNLSALEIELQRLRSVVGSGEADVLLGNAAQIIQDTTNSVREAISDLHPAVLDDYGVLVAITDYIGRIERLTGLRVLVRGAALDARLPNKTELAVFRVAQEALMNVAKHAAATQVTVELSRAGDILRLCVGDDGKGIASAPPGQEPAGGWGVEFMRERAEALGGTLRVESPGGGTRVIMEIPIGNPDHPG